MKTKNYRCWKHSMGQATFEKIKMLLTFHVEDPAETLTLFFNLHDLISTSNISVVILYSTFLIYQPVMLRHLPAQQQFGFNTTTIKQETKTD